MSSLFDPLGLMCPVMLEAKLIMQHIIKQKYGWDDPVQQEEQEKWISWCRRLPALEEVTIPRVYGGVGFSVASSIDLHVFCDASERGIGACAYLRMETPIGVKCALVAAKSRLALMKPTTIPRLELTAAMIGSRVRSRVAEELDLSSKQATMWTLDR